MVGRDESGKDELPENEMMDQVKLVEHLRSVLGHKASSEFTLEDLTPEKTPYLEAVIQEHLRCARVTVAFSQIGELLRREICKMD